MTRLHHHLEVLHVLGLLATDAAEEDLRAGLVPLAVPPGQPQDTQHLPLPGLLSTARLAQVQLVCRVQLIDYVLEVETIKGFCDLQGWLDLNRKTVEVGIKLGVWNVQVTEVCADVAQELGTSPV